MEDEEYLYSEEDLEREDWYGNETPELDELPPMDILESLILSGQLLRPF